MLLLEVNYGCVRRYYIKGVIIAVYSIFALCVAFGLLFLLFRTIKKVATRNVYDKDGYDRNGYNRSGYDNSGYNRNGYDKRGFDRNGINADTETKYDKTGYDCENYDRDGYFIDGYNKEGYNRIGQNRYGYDKNGNYVAHCDNCRLRVRNECTQVRSKLCEDYVAVPSGHVGGPAYGDATAFRFGEHR